MIDVRIRYKLENLDQALVALEAAVTTPKDPAGIIADATLRRFQLAFDRFWKALRAMLDRDGLQAGTPRESLSRGLVAGWLDIDDQQLWLEMLRSRIELRHLYDEARARAICARIAGFLPALRRGHAVMARKFAEEWGA